jgi:restriction system protein
VAEIKHWVSGKRVGGGHLKKFVDVVVRGRHDRGLFLSTSGFAATARQSIAYVEHGRVRTAGHEKIVDLCAMYVRGESGLWTQGPSSTELLFAATS